MSKQPKEPDLFGSDTDDPAGDSPDASWTPPDEPMASNSYGTTEKETRHGESLAERDRHTDPEDAVYGDGDVWSENDADDISAEEAAMHTRELG
jgi:hypothetical protein